MFSINLDKAKNTWLDMYRTARTPLLKKLDLEYMRALESDNKELILELKNKKQELRDITTIDLSAVTHPEELKAMWPLVLGEYPF